MKWLLVTMTIIFFRLGKRASLFVTSLKIKIPRIRLKYLIFHKSSFTLNKSSSGKKNYQKNSKHKTLMRNKNVINLCVSLKLNMTGLSMSGTLKLLKGKEHKNKSMKEKLKKSAEWKKNNRRNQPDSKFSTRIKGRQSTKITPTKFNCSKLGLVNWEKCAKLTTDVSMS